jgi:predicted CopG family antitoxin
MKTIKIADQTHSRLMQAKHQMQCKTASNTIDKLLEAHQAGK